MPKELPLTKGFVAIVDDDWFPMLSQVKWFASLSRATPYAQVNYTRADGTRGKDKLHRLIMDAPAGVQVDHVNGNTLGNRISNLRLCTNSQNIMNVGKRYGETRFKGVSYERRGAAKPFRARITVNGKTTLLGHFATEEQAALAYNEAALRYHGAFAKLNDL